jgi:membrane protein DedA with SNARE-associated domain
MSNIRFERFLAYNVLTALLWSNTFVAAGYLFGVAAEQFVQQLKQFELLFIVALALLAVLYHWLGVRFRPQDTNGDVNETQESHAGNS